MAEEKDLIIIIFLMMVVTVIPRIFPLLIDNNKWPKWIKESLEFLPVAIVTSVVIPGIIFNSFSNYFSIAVFGGAKVIVCINFAFYFRDVCTVSQSVCLKLETKVIRFILLVIV